MRALTIALTLLGTPALADMAGVASVIDGGTIEVHGQRIRLHGIDAPEKGLSCRRSSPRSRCASMQDGCPVLQAGSLIVCLFAICREILKFFAQAWINQKT